MDGYELFEFRYAVIRVGFLIHNSLNLTDGWRTDLPSQIDGNRPAYKYSTLGLLYLREPGSCHVRLRICTGMAQARQGRDRKAGRLNQRAAERCIAP